MPIIYSAVARGPALLAEYSVFAGNFGAVAKECLSRSTAAGRSSHTAGGHVFSFLTEGGYSYVVVSDEASGRTIPNAFLDRVKEDFAARYGERARGVEEGGLSKAYGRRLKEAMEHATQFPEEYSKVASVQKKVDEVKVVMSDNIERVLARGEKLDLLVDRTDNLMSEADRFVKSGRALRRKMWWSNCKMKVVMAGVGLMVVLIIVLLICFSAGGTRCIRKHKPRPSPSPSPSPSPDAAPPPAAAASPAPSESPAPAGGAHRRLLWDLAADAARAAAAAAAGAL